MGDIRLALLALVAACLGSCASYDGHSLVPGTSTAQDAEALMGRPAEIHPAPDGGKVLVFTRAPLGRHTYAVTVGPDDRVLGVAQLLTWANADKLLVGTSTQAQVRDLLGPPGLVSRMALQDRVVWEYKWLHYDDKRVLWVYFSDDGIVREVNNVHDFAADPPSGGRRR